MYPFNLKKALNGAPMTTLCGYPVTNFKELKVPRGVFTHEANVEGYRPTLTFTEAGEWKGSTAVTNLDLMMVNE